MTKATKSSPMQKIGSWFFIFLFPLLVFANEDVSVQTSVDRNVMGVGDTFTLSVAVSAKSSVNVQEPSLPVIQGIETISTWRGSETRSTFVNGSFEVERTTTFNYQMATLKEGKFTIDAIRVTINGRVYNTKPINITVKKSSPSQPRAKNRPRRRNNPFNDMDDLFSQFLQRRPKAPQQRRNLPNVNPEDSFFIQVEVDKSKVYEGEQVLATWYLYTRGQIRDIDTLKYPSLNGFWKEDIEVATRLNYTSEIVNGLAYKKALLASYALFPINAGSGMIDPYRARCTVVQPTAFGFGQPFKSTKESEKVQIEVLPLPKEGRPQNFTGAVGVYNVQAKLDAQTVPTNQPVTFTIRFAGRGNAKLIDLPNLNLPEGLELYDTKKSSKFNKDGTSHKEFEVLVVPRTAGQFEIPEMVVGLFDPTKEAYYTRTIPGAKIEVTPSAEDESIPSAPLAGTEKPAETGPRLPDLTLAWNPNGAMLSQTQVFSLWGLAYLFGALFLLWRAFIELGWGKRQKGVSELVKQRFKKVYTHQNKGDWRAVGVEVTNTMYYLLGEISGQGGASEEMEKLLLKAPPSVRRELGEELLNLLKKFEILSFAPESVVGKLKEKSELKKLVDKMESVLNKAIKLGLGSSLDESNESKVDEA